MTKTDGWIFLVGAMCIYQIVLFLILVRGAKLLSKAGSFSSAVSSFPSLAIVVPARNEEETIETGLQSLAELDYPGLEIVVVNDRSTDQTLQKIKKVQEKASQIKIINILELPEGWLGKNWALQKGAEESRSELILFTDADVEIQSDFLRKGIQFFQLNGLDHLGGIPQVTSRSWYLYPLVGLFGLGFSLFTRPWQGKDSEKDRAVGIGAFNLVKRKSYEAIQGHQALCLRPDDDLKLALVFKRAGFKTDCLNGVEGMRVEWYPNFISLMRGLEKNVMTGFEYSFPLAIVSLALYFVTFMGPFLLLLWAQGIAFYLALLSTAFLLASFSGQLYMARLPLWCVPFMPLATPVIVFVFARACLLTYLQQGVYWRETFYSLQKLRSNRMPFPGTQSQKRTT